MRLFSLICTICIVTYLGIVSGLSFAFRDRVHIVGDLASDVISAVSEQGVPVAAKASQAGVEVILLTDWEKIAFVPGALDLCGSGCFENSENFVRIHRLGLSGYRRTFLINISGYLDEGVAGIFAFDAQGLACLSLRIQSELTSRMSRDPDDVCEQDGTADSFWRIGFN